MTCIRLISLEVNCGFARTAIYENSPTTLGCNARTAVSTSLRASNFRAMFSSTASFGLPNLDYYESKGKKNLSQFDRDCDKVLDGFKKKWPGGLEDKLAYLAQFSRTKWSELPIEDKCKHTRAKDYYPLGTMPKQS